MLYILSWLVSARLPVPCVHRLGWMMWMQDQAVAEGEGMQWGKENTLNQNHVFAIIYILQWRLPCALHFQSSSSPDPYLEPACLRESLPPALQLRLREALQVTFINVQTPQVPMVLFPNPQGRLSRLPLPIQDHQDWALALDLYLA